MTVRHWNKTLFAQVVDIVSIRRNHALTLLLRTERCFGRMHVLEVDESVSVGFVGVIVGRFFAREAESAAQATRDTDE